MSEVSSCQFYTRIGACRHGERCSKRHVKPFKSKTIILHNLYQNPKLNKNEQDLNSKQIDEYFSNFYKDVFVRLAQIDEVADLIVCENENNHLNGNVYCKFKTFDGGKRAVQELNIEWFGGRPVHCDLSPVDNFADANCRAHDTNTCNRGDHCNFMHLKRPTKELKVLLFKAQEKFYCSEKLSKLKGQQDLHSSDNKKDVEVETTNEDVNSNQDFKSTVANLFNINK